MRRSFLFLQGNAGWFYLRLGRALAEAGHDVGRVNICGGDRRFWGDWQAVDFRDEPDAWPAFVERQYEARAVSDIVLFGDCRPVHRAAIAAARRRGIAVHVFEEGYLRPNWVTLERDGVNGHSRLPDDPDWYRATARRLPPFDMGVSVGAGMRGRVVHDFQWQLSNYTRLWRYPHYRTHRPYPIWAEYATWARRLSTLKWRQAEARTAVADLVRGTRPFFLFPLQLDTDSQVRVHSPFGGLAAAIDAVLTDFARHAPAESLLVVKNHPLDNGWIDYRRMVRRRTRALDIAGRVLFLDGGDLNALIDHGRGVVTVNSTVGLTAIQRGACVVALGQAVFDMAGLTHQGPLADFWHRPAPPDPALFAAYRTVLLHACMVNGNFYGEDGVRLAVAGSLARMLSPEDLLADAPPRRPAAALSPCARHGRDPGGEPRTADPCDHPG